MDLPRQFRECWESNIRHHVADFLARRFSENVSCPNDGGKIPVLARSVSAEGTPWLFVWCGYCGVACVYARDPDYGWEPYAEVHWDKHSKTYALGKLYEVLGDQALEPDVVRFFPPRSARI